jgi:hypothetical protein
MDTHIAPIAKQNATRKMLSHREIALLQDLKRDTKAFIVAQESTTAATLIQSYVRRYFAIKTFKHKKQFFVKEKNEAFSELMRNETEYVLNLATIVDRYLLPLQTTRKHILEKVKSVCDSCFGG